MLVVWLVDHDIVFFNLQVSLWTSDPNQFVEDEDDDTFSYSVRISSQDLLLVRKLEILFAIVYHIFKYFKCEYLKNTFFVLKSV